MNRREFLASAAALAAAPNLASAACASGEKGRILFGACRGVKEAKLLASLGYDFWEWSVSNALGPDKDAEWWKQQKELILSQPIPLRSCNGFIPKCFRLTGPEANQAPAVDYAEIALRRAEEVGVKTIVLGSGGARNVPGDFTAEDRTKIPNLEKGAEQYAEFCRAVCARVADLKTVQVVIEPLRPNESNIINFVWQGLQICADVNSPRLAQLADIFHMMMGRESAESIVKAGPLLKHCHIASYDTRLFPGSNPEDDRRRLTPYFDALRKIGYTGGISCECGWGKDNLEKNLETALKTLRSL